MFWTGIFIGLFLGVNLGLAAAGIAAAVRRAREAAVAVPPAASRGDAGQDQPLAIEIRAATQAPVLTYLDRYPHA